MAVKVENFTVCLAGVNVRIHPHFSRVKQLCSDYLTEIAADFEVSVTDEDIQEERRLSEADSAGESGQKNIYPDSYLEMLTVYRKTALKMLDYDAILFHGSAVVVDDKAYLFTAPSGTGKSTHTRLWREYFGQRAWMVNDDKPLLRLTENGVLVCGTPWDGKHHLSRNAMVPLNAICLIERDQTNNIRPMSPRDAFGVCMRQCYLPEEPEQMEKALTLLDRLLGSVRFYRLGCNMEPDAARVAYEGMQ